ncbi:alpha/beta fold hydrolase [Paraconexibacter algicola]|nr:alpha/beta fold hydrolase [Paraconexibacter algicola]
MPSEGPAPYHRGGQGSPLVLLHGFTGTWRMWRPVLAPLESCHDVIALTLPCHHGGPDIAPGATVGIAALADALERSLDDLGLDTVHLSGNSLGGWLSLELARRGRARSVVALSPAGGWEEMRDLQRTARIIGSSVRLGIRAAPFLRAELLPGPVRKFALRATMERGDRVPPDALLEMLEDLGGCTILDSFMEATVRDGPFSQDMSHVTCPIRVAWSQNDRTIPADRHGRPLLQHLPQAEFLAMHGVGHVPMYDDPAQVAATILEVTTAVDEALVG